LLTSTNVGDLTAFVLVGRDMRLSSEPLAVFAVAA
jgi:hypothetical protein